MEWFWKDMWEASVHLLRSTHALVDDSTESHPNARFPLYLLPIACV